MAESTSSEQRVKRKASQLADAEAESAADVSSSSADMDDSSSNESTSDATSSASEESASKKARRSGESQQAASSSGRPDLRFGLPVSVDQRYFDQTDLALLQYAAAARRCAA